MKKRTPEPAASEINAKTEELMKEFFAHVRKVRKQHRGEVDARLIFEAWAIQKIATLQYTVLHLRRQSMAWASRLCQRATAASTGICRRFSRPGAESLCRTDFRMVH